MCSDFSLLNPLLHHYSLLEITYFLLTIFAIFVTFLTPSPKHTLKLFIRCFLLFSFFGPFRALALLSLYPQADPLILGWFPEVVNIAQDVLCEEEHSLVEDAEDFSPSSKRDLDGK